MEFPFKQVQGKYRRQPQGGEGWGCRAVRTILDRIECAFLSGLGRRKSTVEKAL